MVKLFNRFHKTKVSFLNKVKEKQTSSNIFFSNCDNQTKVGFTKKSFCLFVTLRHSCCKINFFLSRQKWNFSNIFKIHFYRVVNAGLVDKFFNFVIILNDCVFNKFNTTVFDHLKNFINFVGSKFCKSF